MAESSFRAAARDYLLRLVLSVRDKSPDERTISISRLMDGAEERHGGSYASILSRMDEIHATGAPGKGKALEALFGFKSRLNERYFLGCVGSESSRNRRGLLLWYHGILGWAKHYGFLLQDLERCSGAERRVALLEGAEGNAFLLVEQLATSDRKEVRHKALAACAELARASLNYSATAHRYACALWLVTVNRDRLDFALEEVNRLMLAQTPPLPFDLDFLDSVVFDPSRGARWIHPLQQCKPGEEESEEVHGPPNRYDRTHGEHKRHVTSKRYYPQMRNEFRRLHHQLQVVLYDERTGEYLGAEDAVSATRLGVEQRLAHRMVVGQRMRLPEYLDALLLTPFVLVSPAPAPRRTRAPKDGAAKSRVVGSDSSSSSDDSDSGVEVAFGE